MTEPVRVDLYTRADCPLCDEAKEVLSRGLSGTPHHLVEHDVDADPAARALYGDDVPVVEVDGVERFTGRVNPVLLRRLIRGKRRKGGFWKRIREAIR